MQRKLTAPLILTFCLWEDFMRNDKPSKTARKVALNIVTLGAKHGMEFFSVATK